MCVPLYVTHKRYGVYMLLMDEAYTRCLCYLWMRPIYVCTIICYTQKIRRIHTKDTAYTIESILLSKGTAYTIESILLATCIGLIHK